MHKENEPFRKFYKKGKSSGSHAPKKQAASANDPAKKEFPDKGKKASFKASGTSKIFPKKYSGKEERPRFGETPQKDNRSGSKKAFGKFEDADLSFGKSKKAGKQAARLPEKPAITFSKSIEKWDNEPVAPPYGKIKGKSAGKDRNKSTDKFKRRFDSENPHEKAFESRRSSRKPATGQMHAQEERKPEEQMPLNKFLAHCDVCSRRDAVTLIKEGKVKVNGTLITEPGYKVAPADQVTLSGKKLTVQKNLVYILLNKPKGYITTTDDPKGRDTVMKIFEHHIEERIFPVGRLDRNTTGLLLLTNDGVLAQELAHPKYEIRKVYQVTLNKSLDESDYEKICQGVTLEDGPAPVDQIAYLEHKNELGLEIHNGKNRIVRRIFESLGYEVEKLDRVMYAGLTKKNLPRGKWRFLSKQEVINLKHLH